jgi:hypothetical protein
MKVLLLTVPGGSLLKDAGLGDSAKDAGANPEILLKENYYGKESYRYI